MVDYRWLLMALLAVLITGCSGLRLGYRHADTYLAWRADDYFDLDSRQKQDFNARVERLLAWHRREQLPEYAAFLNSAIQKGKPAPRREDIIWFVDGITARYRTVVDRIIDDAAEMLAGMEPRQIAELQKQWDKDNRNFLNEHELEGPLADRKLARQRRLLKQIVEWTGYLSDDQEEKVTALINTIPYINHLRHQDRIRRQKEFLELLKLRTRRAEFQPRLHAWLRDWDLGRTREYAQLSEQVYEKRIQFYIDVEKLLTPAQRQAAWRRLQEFADDFSALSKKTAQRGSHPDAVVRLALLCAAGGHACLPE